MGGNLNIDSNPSLTTLDGGLVALTGVGGNLRITENPDPSLTTLDGGLVALTWGRGSSSNRTPSLTTLADGFEFATLTSVGSFVGIRTNNERARRGRPHHL